MAKPGCCAACDELIKESVAGILYAVSKTSTTLRLEFLFPYHDPALGPKYSRIIDGTKVVEFCSKKLLAGQGATARRKNAPDDLLWQNEVADLNEYLNVLEYFFQDWSPQALKAAAGLRKTLNQSVKASRLNAVFLQSSPTAAPKKPPLVYTARQISLNVIDFAYSQLLLTPFAYTPVPAKDTRLVNLRLGGNSHDSFIPKALAYGMMIIDEGKPGNDDPIPLQPFNELAYVLSKNSPRKRNFAEVFEVLVDLITKHKAIDNIPKVTEMVRQTKPSLKKEHMAAFYRQVEDCLKMKQPRQRRKV